jgi:PBSX family phage portal protein
MAETEAKKSVGEVHGSPRVFFVNKRASVRKNTAFSSAEGGVKSTEIDALRDSKTFVVPPHDLESLEELVRKNTVLPPLIDAMEANVDGPGWELIPKNRETPPDEVQKQMDKVSSFFKQPWPGQSFTTIRKRKTRNYEEIGNGYFEALRNPKGKLIFLRWLDAKTIRLVRLDEAVVVTHKLERDGVEVETKTSVRERRFLQFTNRTDLSELEKQESTAPDAPANTHPGVVYFKEFGATRDLNKRTGEWATEEKPVSFADRATELIHFVNKPDVDSAYGLPRWWSNIPSVVGSRKAEEFNIEFFDAGGVPPLLLILSGGKMAEDAERLLTKHFMSSGPDRHSAAILEAYATGGDIDSPQNVKVTVERFGAERQQDSMFENYMSKCDERVRRAFRLPPIYTGTSTDYSFATAFASYTVAEAQIFKPERDEFDEIVNLLIMPELEGGDQFVFRTKSLSVRDTAQQLAALEMVKDRITPENLIEQIEQVADLDLRIDPDAEKMRQERLTLEIDQARADKDNALQQGGDNADKFEQGNDTGSGKNRKGLPSGSEPVRTDAVSKLNGVAAVVDEAATALLNRDTDKFEKLRQRIERLPAVDAHVFRTMLAAALFPELGNDPEGAAEMAGCAFAMLSRGED